MLLRILGFIASKVHALMKCHTCTAALISSRECRPQHQLISKRDKGGLVYPAEGLVNLIHKAEMTLRASQSVVNTSSLVSPLYLKIQVMSQFDTAKILGIETHALETTNGIANHHERMVSYIIQQFYNVRQQHVIKLQNHDLHHDLMLRQRNNHMTLFAGQ